MFVGDSATAVQTRTELLSDLQAQVIDSTFEALFRLIDSGWNTFEVLSDGHAIIPSPDAFCSKPMTKREVVDRVNGRSNQPVGGELYPTDSLHSKKRERIVRELVDLLLRNK
jgi:hypothetical protein